jgi:putative FmdB family regulatory protein
MPTYQYRCQSCHRRFEIFIPYDQYGTQPVHCTFCQSDKVVRRIGKVRFARSEESRLENMADFDNLEGLENDPQALGQMMRKMGHEMGEELGPEFNEVVDRLEKGQSPEDIEKAMPDLGEAGGGMGPGSLEDDY